MDPSFWGYQSVLVTGHTGFKGAWLSLWLQSLGARVTGLSLAAPPTAPSLYALARVADGLAGSVACDIRDPDAVTRAVVDANPEIVIHMAAQPLVRRSFAAPLLTYETNVMGTVAVLDAVRACEGVRAVVVVTSDKCYESRDSEGDRGDSEGDRGGSEGDRGGSEGGQGDSEGDRGGSEGHRESDPLGGHDPYSSSKAAAELVTSAYRRSVFAAPDGPRVATARAGNTIGGGDWGEDRLVPDLVRAAAAGRVLRLRHPRATRPWQHVLSPLGGYLVLAQALHRSPEYARAWNFGPDARDARTVEWIVQRFGELWPGGVRFERDHAHHPPEARRLVLDSSLARARLGWAPLLDLDEGLAATVAWYRAWREGADLRALTLAQIAGAAPG